MKHFVSSLLTLYVPTSLIWLHDGIWVAPAPPRSLIDTANRLATTAIQISPLPLQLSCTPLFPKYKEAYQSTIHGSPPPSQLRLLHPPLSELEARQAFIRMMARQQQPLRDTIRTQPPPLPYNQMRLSSLINTRYAPRIVGVCLERGGKGKKKIAIAQATIGLIP